MNDNLPGAIAIFGGGLIVLLYAFPVCREFVSPIAMTLYGTTGITLYVFSK
jgi:hypothetical protein